MSKPKSDADPLSPAELRTLYKLLRRYRAETLKDNLLGAEIISLVSRWVELEDRYDT